MSNMGHHTAAEVRALRAEVNQLRRQVNDLRRMVVELGLDVRLAETRVERRVAARFAGARDADETDVVDVRDPVEEDVPEA